MTELSGDDLDRRDGPQPERLMGTLPETELPTIDPIDPTEPDTNPPSAAETYTFYLASSEEAENDPEMAVGTIASGMSPASDLDYSTIGEYRIERCLGKGAFGSVYLAIDVELGRSVAIKVPHKGREGRPDLVDGMIREARILASLEHQGIVPVYHIGRLDDGRCYIVSKYIDGTNLSTRLRRGEAGFEVVAAWVARAAEALDFAHNAGIVHRDVKPANLLLDSSGNLFVADFGLALHESESVVREGFAGTPSYTSPEQARREGHRVDPRSDLFSLGVVLYECLTGSNPFKAANLIETLDNVCNFTPVPLTEINPAIPHELGRICMRSIAKRSDDRYQSARAFAHDLRQWLETACNPTIDHQRSPRLTPRGLRAFEASDAQAFLELVPGPRGRDGMPESLLFWKNRIEGRSGVDSFPVGVLYGPSGSGKSSLVRAGLLPLLSPSIRVVYVEATSEETEKRLLAGLRRIATGLSPADDLASLLRGLRLGHGLRPEEKVLIVIDQFEQWISGRSVEGRRILEDALRQCDGQRVQAILLVRDEFWMDLTRFARAIESRLVDGENAAAVDLFDLDHARKVLVTLGQAYDRLPPPPSTLGREHTEFLDLALAGLARDDRVICVRLVLLAELLRAKPWTPATLKALGGIDRIGAMILDEAFSPESSYPRLRPHRRAAREVLARLLPERGTLIKGHMVARDELFAASGYTLDPEAFDALMSGLDHDLRVVTPAEPIADPGASTAHDRPRFYQLAHDSLVPDLRAWLLRDSQQTMRGRAQLRLQDFTTLWTDGKKPMFLPSTWEWLFLVLMTRPKTRTPSQRRMLHAATSRQAKLGLIAAMAIALFAGIGYWIYADFRARSGVESLATAEIQSVPSIAKTLRPYARWAIPRLKAQVDDAAPESRLSLNTRLALLEHDGDQARLLLDPLIAKESSAQVVLTLRDALRPHRTLLIPALQKALESAETHQGQKLRAAVALAEYDPPASGSTSTRWAEASVPVTDALIQAIDDSPSDYASFVSAVEPIRSILIPRMMQIFIGPDARYRSILTNLVADLAKDDPATIVEFTLNSDPSAFAKFVPILVRNKQVSLPLLQAEARRKSDPVEADKNMIAGRRRAIAALALMHMGRLEDAWPVYRNESDPNARSFLIHKGSLYGVSTTTLLDRLGTERDPTTLRGLLLACAMHQGISGHAEKARSIATRLVGHPDGGVVGAAEALVGRLPGIEPTKTKPVPISPTRRWYITREGQVMVILDARNDPRIGRAFAIASKETTVDQMLEFIPTYWVEPMAYEDRHKGPVGVVRWATAIDYCKWLDRRDGFDASDSPYPAEGARGMEKMPTADPKKPGYRLPTAAEFEYACRAATKTDRFFGDDLSLVDQYAVFGANKKLKRVGSLLPNDFGLFDLYGNVAEWTSDLGADSSVMIAGGSYNAYPIDLKSTTISATKPDLEFNSYGFRVVRTIELDADGNPRR